MDSDANLRIKALSDKIMDAAAQSHTGHLKTWKAHSLASTYVQLSDAKAARTRSDVRRSVFNSLDMEGIDEPAIDAVTVVICQHCGWV